VFSISSCRPAGNRQATRESDIIVFNDEVVLVGSPWPSRWGWWQPTTNTDPGLAPYPRFLGFYDWPLAVSISSIPKAIGLLGVLL
jgi:hypothetical protein